MKPLMKNPMSPTPQTDTSTSQASGLPRGMDALAHEIARVERRLIAREIGIQNRLQYIREGARSALRPRRSMVPWAGLLVVLWPLLPRFLRPRLSPASAITVFGMAAPMVKRLLTNHPAGPATVPDLDLTRYMGRWHEVACLSHGHEPSGAGLPSTLLTPGPAPRGDGTTWIDVRRQSMSASGRLRETRGVARVVPGSGNARLKMSFLPAWARWWPGAWDDHWVLHVNADYTEAVVGEPGRRHITVISRDGVIAPERLEGVMDLLRSQGYDVDFMRSRPSMPLR